MAELKQPHRVIIADFSKKNYIKERIVRKSLEILLSCW